LLACRCDELFLAKNVNGSALALAQADVELAKNLFVGFNLFFNQITLRTCFNQLESGPGDFRRQGECCGPIVGEAGF